MQQDRITLDVIRRNPKVKTYMEAANNQMKALGYTEHGFRHAGIVAETAQNIMTDLGQDPRHAELAAISGFMHDIGNAVSRQGHTDTAALMAFTLLNEMDMPANEIALVIAAIGNHEEEIGAPVSSISAALIIADKSDVHHSRVQNQNPLTFDIHDRVNFAVRESAVTIDKSAMSITLSMTIDTKYCSVMDYFEIFLGRMLLCRRAAEYLGLFFRLVINGQQLL